MWRSGALSRLMMLNWEPSRGKGAFVRQIPSNARVLDVGCGNNSPKWFKTVRPDIYYIGIDVRNYNQSEDPSQIADEYTITTPESFVDQIYEYRGQIDAVICSHNLEHCNEPNEVLMGISCALKPGGKLYLSFPCEVSVSFPHRQGCLNFYDDPTHKIVPCWKCTLRELQRAGFVLDYIAKRYRPFPLILRGLFFEPMSAIQRLVIPDGSTWALYGFESVIWASLPGMEVELGDWGPKETNRGKAVNVQPDGTSAMWIVASNVSRFGDVWVEFGKQRPKGPAVVKENLITTGIPEEIFQKPGLYNVVIVESSGRITKIGDFLVRP
jgi:SAM-dependent methyltransferase